jgi:hypothetical protein
LLPAGGSFSSALISQLDTMKDLQVTRREAASRWHGRRLALAASGALAFGTALITTLSIGSASALAYDAGVGLADGGATLSFVAKPGQSNLVTVQRDGDFYAVRDEGVASIDDADGPGGCEVIAGAPNYAACPASVTLIRIDLGDGDDFAEVDAGTNAILIGGDGADTLIGGDGDDNISSRDGAVDKVTCGAGGDSATVDQRDMVSADCEHVIDAPETTIISGPPEFSNSTSATFEFTSSDPNSTFECILDGEVVECPSADMTQLSEDKHTFEVAATDRFGNVDTTPASLTWTIDLTAPDTTIISGPQATTDSTTISFKFSSDDPDVASFECRLDGSDWIGCASPTVYSNLPDGSHAFSVRAVDRAGNRDASDAAFSFTVKAPAGASRIQPSSLVLIAGRAVKVSKRGFAKVALNCSGTKDCAGTLILATARPVRFSRRRKRIVRLGRTRFLVPATRTGTVKVHLSRRKVRLVRSVRRLEVDVIVKDLDRAGRARVSTRTIILKAPR